VFIWALDLSTSSGNRFYFSKDHNSFLAQKLQEVLLAAALQKNSPLAFPEEPAVGDWAIIH
jgi:hypothetical protein